ncbi:hypothetical protein [Pseudomonas sp. PICF141]|uniref:hypothetical protein n=1 Tax=Pseudomonas sp. PICF141 TaxID=1949067 RepID=UPI000BABF6EA|nr:hypothetical protein [Pseudomonas sp. PICF141]PAU59238.1 hypothetical protein BZL43_09620 [Pseudomonas sp. PICF141]
MIKINTIKPFSGLSKYELWRSQWADKNSVDVFAYMSDVCSPEDSLLFCRLLFPDFVVVGEAVILESKYNVDVFASWMQSFEGDIGAVERMLNHTHLYDVFAGCTDKVDDVVFEQLCEIVALSWRLVLKDKFPNRLFSVEVSNSDQDYGPVVTFFQVIKQA